MRKYFVVSIVLLMLCATAGAQGYLYTSQHKATENRTMGTFYLEYNPLTWHDGASNVEDTNFQGLSVGFSYFVPVMGSLGFDAGLKGQYFFRSEKENGVKYKSNMFAATLPVNLVYDWRLSSGFAVCPYAGLYGRIIFSAKNIEETGNKRNTFDLFDDNQAKRYGFETINRVQVGWQAGLNFRISDMVTIGGAYWMDISKLRNDTSLHGFNLTLGANF